jgi:hypothetical protein
VEPCEALKKWKAIRAQAERAPGPLAELGQAELHELQAEQHAELLAAIRELKTGICKCLTDAQADLVQALSRPMTSRGLTRQSTNTVDVPQFTTTQLCGRNPQRRFVAFGVAVGNVTFCPDQRISGLGFGFTSKANTTVFTVDDAMWGAYAQSAWFAWSTLAGIQTAIVTEEIYLGDIGEKQLWQPDNFALLTALLSQPDPSPLPLSVPAPTADQSSSQLPPRTFTSAQTPVLPSALGSESLRVNSR